MRNRNTSRDKVIPIKRCSWCLTQVETVDLLVASKVPGVYICTSCVTATVTTVVRHRPAYHAKFVRLLKRIAPRAAADRAPR